MSILRAQPPNRSFVPLPKREPPELAPKREPVPPAEVKRDEPPVAAPKMEPPLVAVESPKMDAIGADADAIGALAAALAAPASGGMPSRSMPLRYNQHTTCRTARVVHWYVVGTS